VGDIHIYYPYNYFFSAEGMLVFFGLFIVAYLPYTGNFFINCINLQNYWSVNFDGELLHFFLKFNGSTQLNLYFISYQQVFNSYMSISGVGFQQDQLLIIMLTLRRNMK
jgi:hypothetical protein